MEVRDIRVGNWIFSGENYVRVENIMPYGINYMAQEEDVDYDINGISGIPLTEEILLKCGLTKPFKNGHTWLKDTMSIVFYNGIVENVGGVQIQIKYLHQLQNLYFVLTGKELEVNL